MDKTEWHQWFAWYPIHTIELGWVWFHWTSRKQIPADYICEVHPKFMPWSRALCEKLTGCWHRDYDPGP